MTTSPCVPDGALFGTDGRGTYWPEPALFDALAGDLTTKTSDDDDDEQ